MLLVAGGFFAGVEVEKGQSSSSPSSGFPAGLAALRAGGASSSSSRSTNGPAAGGGTARPSRQRSPRRRRTDRGRLTTGEVSYVSGSTLYVNGGENTVKVSAPAGTKVSKTVSTNVGSIHPGDTVIVRGSQSSNGSVTASSISINSATSATSASGSSGAGRSSGAGAAQQLFGG